VRGGVAGVRAGVKGLGVMGPAGAILLALILDSVTASPYTIRGHSVCGFVYCTYQIAHVTIYRVSC
jgi:hypothetical protein